MKYNKESVAQGTIEYLVILAIVVVISLIVVGLFVTLMDSPSQAITDSSAQAGSVAVGGISIVEAVIDYEGDSLIRLNNNSSDAITLNRISVGGVDNNFSEQLVGLDSKVFSLSSLNSNCPCENGQKSVKCEVKIIYTTSTGITQTEYRIINAQCVDDSTPVNLITVVDPIRENCFDSDDDPIQICSLSDLNQIRTKLDGNYILMRDINAYETRTWNDNLGWDPIGNSENPFNTPFTGTFDGQGKTISNLYSNNWNEDFVGLFCYTENALISNLKLLNVNMSGVNWIGGLIGLGTLTTIGEVEVSGIITGQDSIGGIAGNLSGSTISNSYNHANIGAGADTTAGGIVGNFTGNIINSYNTGPIHGYSKVGGIVGEFAGEIINSYNTGTITGDSDNIGGIVGLLENSEIRDSYNTGRVSGNYSVGGIVGYSTTGIITDSYSTGAISGVNDVGGIAGYSYDSALIENVYNTGVITASQYSAGGIVGYNYYNSTINDAYNTGTIDGFNFAGGIAAYNQEATISNSYNTGAVSAMYSLGGIVGSNDFLGIVKNTYNTGNLTVENDGISEGLYAGGIVGSSVNSTIINSFNFGTIGNSPSVSARIGGISGSLSEASIINCYSTGAVYSSGASGGIVGYYDGPYTITNSYWFDVEGDDALYCDSSSDDWCTKSENISNFYSSTYGVYTSSPIWNDGNWSWTQTTYPSLS